MEADILPEHSVTDEKVCITQYEHSEYDSCSWENEDFVGKISSNTALHQIF